MESAAPAVRRDAEQSDRDGRAPLFQLHRYGLGFVQKHLPLRMRISNNTTLTLSRPTGEGRAGSVSCSFKSGWIHLPTEDDSPSSQSDWKRAGVRVSLFQNPKLFLHESFEKRCIKNVLSFQSRFHNLAAR